MYASFFLDRVQNGTDKSSFEIRKKDMYVGTLRIITKK